MSEISKEEYQRTEQERISNLLLDNKDLRKRVSELTRLLGNASDAYDAECVKSGAAAASIADLTEAVAMRDKEIADLKQRLEKVRGLYGAECRRVESHQKKIWERDKQVAELQEKNADLQVIRNSVEESKRDAHNWELKYNRLVRETKDQPTLRDQFAMAALQWLPMLGVEQLADSEQELLESFFLEAAPRRAFRIADAMLEERSKKDPRKFSEATPADIALYKDADEPTKEGGQ